jgi:hypothetical protein
LYTFAAHLSRVAPRLTVICEIKLLKKAKLQGLHIARSAQQYVSILDDARKSPGQANLKIQGAVTLEG